MPTEMIVSVEVSMAMPLLKLKPPLPVLNPSIVILNADAEMDAPVTVMTILVCDVLPHFTVRPGTLLLLEARLMDGKKNPEG